VKHLVTLKTRHRASTEHLLTFRIWCYVAKCNLHNM